MNNVKNKKNSPKPKLIAITGPTSSGKSSLAVYLAKKINGEVISCDSRQVYKDLNLSSGKITPKEMAEVPHHCLDIASPRRRFTISQYQAHTLKAIKSIYRRGRLPIICGGSNHYLDAVLYHQIFPAVKPNPALRSQLTKLSPAALFSKLKKLDPIRAKTIDKHNPRRLIRALEIIYTTNRPVPAIKKSSSPYQFLKIGIYKDKQALHHLISARLKSRIKQGMINEISDLRSAGLSDNRLEDLGLECRFILHYLQGKITSRQELINQLTQAIINYSKRQLTWLKKDPDIIWVKTESEALKITNSLPTLPNNH